MSNKDQELSSGQVFETVFWRNEGARVDEFPYRAVLIDGQKSGKVLLCRDRTIAAGKPARVRVKRITRPQDPKRGFIEVDYMGPVEFKLNPNIYIDKQVSRKLQVLLEAGYSILLDGPQGSGKTVLSRAIADALEMKYIYFNCASVYEATDFIATLQVRASESGVAETVFIETNVSEALQEAADRPDQRYLIFLDEFNRCRPFARNGLMPALDSTRKVFNPATNQLLDIPDNVQFIAAINNGAQFVGTAQVDPAQVDRFATLKVSYPPQDEEAKILARKFPGVNADTIRAVVLIAAAIRSDETLCLDLSMRATEEACVMLSHPYFSEDLSPAEAMEEVLITAFCGRFQGDVSDQASDAFAVYQVIVKMIKKVMR